MWTKNVGSRSSSREVLSRDDFTDDDISALEEPRAPESSKAFDDEVKLHVPGNAAKRKIQ
jgi:hypothetical protein